MYAHASNHHGGGTNSLWCKSTRVEQDLLIRNEPDRFFKPPYVGPSGWVGIRLDGADMKMVADIVRDAYRLTAPKRLLKMLDPAKRT
jgi:hypothetical protein